jgi:cation transport ATPase
VYKWEDANGMHYTDSPGSVPEKYREKVYAETREQIKNSTPQSRVGVATPISPSAIQQNQAAINQANLEQQRRTAETIKQQQANASKSLEHAFDSFARFMAIWILGGLLLLIAWITTIVNIVGSEFINPSNKTVWLILVLLLPLLGMLLYFILGSSQKVKSEGYKDPLQEELLARLKPRDPNDKEFVI